MLKLSKKTEKTFKDPEIIDLSSMPEKMRDQAMAEYMLKVITEAKNDGWVADYKDENQRKWIPWFYLSPSGARFDLSSYDYSDAIAGLAARLCFKDEATSDAAGKELVDLYEIAING
ncbi:MAG TPA: hypothetical protein PKC47_02010 [Petrimonas sp.]|nr:hypothetical protein [Petrimonas sp.]